MQMKIYTMVNGQMIKPMVKEYIDILMVPVIEDLGLQINNMVLVRSIGLMVLNMKVSINKVRKMGLVCLNGLMVVLTMENLKTIILREMEYMFGLMEENSKVLGKITKCLVGVYLHGKIIGNILENMLMIRRKDLAYLIGLMVDNIVVNGKVESNMDLAYTHHQKVRVELENGGMVKE